MAATGHVDVLLLLLMMDSGCAGVAAAVPVSGQEMTLELYLQLGLVGLNQWTHAVSLARR